MADISIQFHALPEELLPFVRQCVADFDLRVVGMRFFPFEAVEVSYDKLDFLFSDSSPFRELALFLDKPLMAGKTQLDFYDQNPKSLRLDICRIQEMGLEQSWLCARTDDVEALSVWKKLANRLRRITKTGLVVVNPQTGAQGPARGARLTEGAMGLEAKGIRMVSPGGRLIYRLDVK